MQRFDKEELRKYLISKNEKAAFYAKAAEDVLDGIIMSSDGRIGMALSLLSDREAKENAESRRQIERIIEAIRPSVPYSELYSAISALPTSRLEFTTATEALICAVRDITVIKFDDEAPLLFYTSRERARAASQDISAKRLLNIHEVLKSALEDVSKNVSTSAIITDLGAKIRLI